MPKKRYSKDRTTCQVTFELPKDVQAASVHVCGDFNDWSPQTHELKRLKNGTFKLALRLAAERRYRYRFLLDGERWENDWVADAYQPNDFGSDDSVVEV